MTKSKNSNYTLELMLVGRLDLPEDRCDPAFPGTANSFSIPAGSLGKIEIPAETLSQLDGEFYLETSGHPKTIEEFHELFRKSLVEAFNFATIVEQSGMTLETAAKALAQGGLSPNISYDGVLNEDQIIRLSEMGLSRESVGAK